MPMLSERSATEIPPTVDLIVVALCADYGRREEAIRTETESPRTRMEYEYFNRHIRDAAEPFCSSPEEAQLFIEEIGQRVGYAKSRTPLSETAYKERKRCIRLAIVRALHLLG